MTIEDIKRLKFKYCFHLDSTNTSEFVDLFTEDAKFDVPNYGSGEGKGAIREFITEIKSRDLELMAHMASNPLIEIDDNEATGKWYYIVIIEDDEGNVSWGQGRWEDTYRRVDDDWKISSLIAIRQFTREIPKR
ncbi:nuclear transport factor 2 family protein [Halorarum salinum]|uniref:Nuclear transport factor 2 family protein n=1 Tax=Halorarum salinum TaxID=2743089 RepID=A0A7D5L8E6_9EURY|nr:nuclear transport factor 2 family protein [Halobaculum salinum]QLG60287.1 nuclear transport factor 2 family protein [Halobaculum salinum]